MSNLRDLQTAYAQLSYGNCRPRVIAGHLAKIWIIETTPEKFRMVPETFLGGDVVVESGDVPDNTVRFIASVPEGSIHPVTGKPFELDPIDVVIDI